VKARVDRSNLRENGQQPQHGRRSRIALKLLKHRLKEGIVGRMIQRQNGYLLRGLSR
jgi:hypothetical protein